MKNTLLFFLIFIIFSAYTQSETEEIRVYTNLTQLLSKQVNVGVEKTYRNTIYGADLSYYLNSKVTRDSVSYSKSVQGNALDVNVKRVFANSGLYLGVGAKVGYVNYSPLATFRFADEVKEQEGFKAEVSSGDVVKQYEIEKKIAEFNGKVGMRGETELFVIDVFVGLGLRMKDVKHVYPTQFTRIEKYDAYIRYRDKLGRYSVPVVKFGVLVALRVRYPKK